MVDTPNAKVSYKNHFVEPTEGKVLRILKYCSKICTISKIKISKNTKLVPAHMPFKNSQISRLFRNYSKIPNLRRSHVEGGGSWLDTFHSETLKNIRICWCSIYIRTSYKKFMTPHHIFMFATNQPFGEPIAKKFIRGNLWSFGRWPSNFYENWRWYLSSTFIFFSR